MTKAQTIVRLKFNSEHASGDQVSAKLGLRPSKTWAKGACRPGTKIIEKHHVWIYERTYKGTDNLASHVKHFLKLLAPRSTKISLLSGECEGILSIVTYSDSPPPLYFERSSLRQITSMSLGLDIDLYL